MSHENPPGNEDESGGFNAKMGPDVVGCGKWAHSTDGAVTRQLEIKKKALKLLDRKASSEKMPLTSPLT
jgi:hypothetical protein